MYNSSTTPLISMSWLTLAALSDTPWATFLNSPPTLPLFTSPSRPDDTSLISPMGLPRKSTEPTITAAWLRISYRNKQTKTRFIMLLERGSHGCIKSWSSRFCLKKETRDLSGFSERITWQCWIENFYVRPFKSTLMNSAFTLNCPNPHKDGKVDPNS